MKIAIAGAGWYGCHIAYTLKQNGFKIKLFEKNSDIFQEASSNNQFRLHQGLHYARSSVTRYQSRDGFFRFSERYPYFSKSVDENYYLVPKYESLIDIDTYFSIMFSSGLNIERRSLSRLPFIKSEKIQGLIKCQEKIILTSKAKAYFQKELKDIIYSDSKVSNYNQSNNGVIVNGEQFNFFIDATWGALAKEHERVYFEATVLFYYESKCGFIFPAITLVDGELWSIYPTETLNVYTLSHVLYTPLGKYKNKLDAYNKLKNIKSDNIKNIRKKIETHVLEYFPSFYEYFRCIGEQFSIKTKPVGKDDARSVSVEQNGKIFTVYSGKIDNIFQASDFILGQISLD